MVVSTCKHQRKYVSKMLDGCQGEKMYWCLYVFSDLHIVQDNYLIKVHEIHLNHGSIYSAVLDYDFTFL